MTIDGVTLSYLVRDVWLPQLSQNVFYNTWMFDQSYFPIVDSPGGAAIQVPVEYSVSTNVGTFAYDDAMVAPYTSNHIKGYFNKDHFQESVRTFGVYEDYLANGSGNQLPSLDYIRKAFEGGMLNLRDKITTTVIADLESQIDSSSAWSDASLTRSTYSLAAYEETTSTALTIAHMEAMVDALLTPTGSYGQVVRGPEELLIMMPRNLLRTLATASTGVAYNATFQNWIVSAQDTRPVDLGRLMNLKTFEGIEMAVVNDMTSSVVLCVHKPSIKIYRTKDITPIPKSEAAYTNLWQLVGSFNIVAENPRSHAKLSAKS